MSDNHIVSLRPNSTTPEALGVQPRSPRHRGKGVVALILFVSLIVALWWYIASLAPTTSQQVMVPSASTTVAAQTRTGDDLIARVGALIDLPVGEVPTIATVSDPSKLEDQAFFAKATKGDIVFIYTKARVAYLYDPVRNKLVQVAPITTNTGTVVPPVQTTTDKTGAVKQ